MYSTLTGAMCTEPKIKFPRKADPAEENWVSSCLLAVKIAWLTPELGGMFAQHWRPSKNLYLLWMALPGNRNQMWSLFYQTQMTTTKPYSGS